MEIFVEDFRLLFIYNKILISLTNPLRYLFLIIIFFVDFSILKNFVKTIVLTIVSDCKLYDVYKCLPNCFLVTKEKVFGTTKQASNATYLFISRVRRNEETLSTLPAQSFFENFLVKSLSTR